MACGSWQFLVPPFANSDKGSEPLLSGLGTKGSSQTTNH
jgi:hypothetical protein